VGSAQSEGEPAPRGILDPGAIDAAGPGDDGVLELHIEQTTEWDGSDHLLLLTQEKLYNYLAYAADNELTRFRVVLDCTSSPDARTRTLLRAAEGELRKLGGELCTRCDTER
jgi:hypothetical protein